MVQSARISREASCYVNPSILYWYVHPLFLILILLVAPIE